MAHTRQSPCFFSIIITCYNYATYVSSAIESALDQTYCDFEVIVVNDGSTDRSWDVICGYRDKIKAINTVNRGSISACLTGFAASHGSHVIFLDADDLLHPNALSKAAAALSDDVSKIQFMLQPIDKVGTNIGDPFPRLPRKFDNDTMLESINRLGFYPTPPTSGNIYRRDVYSSLGSIDYDFGIDGVAYLVAPFKGKVINLNETLGYYRIHGSNMSGVGKASHLKMQREKGVFLRRLEHLADLLKEIPSKSALAFARRKSYLYDIEREVFVDVLQGRRPTFRLTRRYVAAINNSLPGMQRASYLFFAFLLIVPPNLARQKVLEFRMNPARTSSLRIFVKRIMG